MSLLSSGQRQNPPPLGIADLQGLSRPNGGTQSKTVGNDRIHVDSPLDVLLVHFSSVPRGAYGDLEKGRKKLKMRSLPTPAPPVAAADAAPEATDGALIGKAFAKPLAVHLTMCLQTFYRFLDAFRRA